MINCNKLNKPVSRREFLKKSSLFTAGALGYSLGMKPRCTNANTPGVTGNRVVLVHDPSATFWDGATGYYGDYVSQDRVNAMIEKGIKELTGESSAVSAWQQIIPGYSPGKKIGIKVNINNSGADNIIDALPQPANAIITGLKNIGVLESDIYVMDPSRPFPSKIGDPIINLYPSVLLWGDGAGNSGHTVTYTSGDPSLTIHHSHPSLSDSNLPDQVGELTYLINMPIMKGHGISTGAGITLAFKNNFGILKAWQCANFHPYSYIDSPGYSYDMNPLHDIYQNPHVKDKTVLIVGDALFGDRYSNADVPQVWNSFSGEFPNSLFLSSDPVAIDSVMFDFLNAEIVRHENSHLYLHRAVELGLGTHEHWNNPTDKQYSLIDFRKVGMSVVTRRDIDKEVKNFKEGNATETQVKEKITTYMESL